MLHPAAPPEIVSRLMRKLLKVLGWAAGVVAVLGAIAAVVVTSQSRAALAKTYAVSVRAIAIPAEAASLERGARVYGRVLFPPGWSGEDRQILNTIERG